MTIKRILVFSGFDTRLVERTRASLRANQIEVIFAKLEGFADPAYFKILMERVWSFLIENSSESGTRVIGLLASCCSDEPAKTREREVFFPSFRRRGFPTAYKNELGRAREIVETIVKDFTSDEFIAAGEYIKARSAPILALPLRNAESARLLKVMADLYELKEMTPAANLSKEIVRRKGAPGFRIRDLDFVGCTNSAKHPIRRCTESITCDVAGWLRLGFSLPKRFEFDVTSERGVSGRRFFLCDDTVQIAPTWASHVNMRINDDHGFAA